MSPSVENVGFRGRAPRGLVPGAGLALVLGGAALTCASCSLDIEGRDVGRAAAAVAVTVPPSPVVEITSPARGSFLAPGPVQLEGRVAAVDSAAVVREVFVGSQVVPLGADGTFRTQVTLDRGMNILSASVQDARGGKASAQIAVLAGEWAPLGQPLPDALAIRANDPALDAIASIVEPLVAGIDLARVAQDPVYDGSLLGGLFSARVSLQNPSLSVGRARIDGAVDGLHVRAEVLRPVTDVKVEARAVASLPTEFATVTADRALLGARLVLVRGPSGRLRIDIHDVDVAFDNFQVTWNSGTIMPLILPLLRGWMESKLEGLLASEIAGLQASLHTALADLLAPQTPAQVFGAPLSWSLLPERIAHDADGVEASFSFDASAPAPTPRSAAAPGSFHTPALAPLSLGTARGLEVRVDDDMINRLLHAAWAAGLLERDLGSLGFGLSPSGSQATGTPSTAGSGPASASGGGLFGASGGGGLTLGDLALFLPEVRGVADESAPVSARFEALLPPVLQVTGAPDLATLSLGEVHLSLLVDRGGPTPDLLLTVAVHLRAGVTVASAPGQGIVFSSNRNAEVGVDLVEAPLVRIDERRLQVVLGTALTPLVPRLVNQVGVLPIPSQLSHLRVFNLSAFAAGPSGDRLAVELDMQR